MDDIDRRLLTELSHNGRATYQELATLVHLSSNSVSERLHKLQREGILVGFTTVIDATKLGRTLGIMSDIRLRDGVDRVSFAQSLTKVPQVIEALRVTGEYDYLLRMACTDTAELDHVIDLLKHDYGVASVNSRLIIREVSADPAKLLTA